jgi:hypothetical protein
MTYNDLNNSIKLYVDNSLDFEDSNYSVSMGTNNLDIYIGRESDVANPGYYFNGIIDEVRISNIAKDFNGAGGDDPPEDPVPPEPGEVVINEIMWMGTAASSSDEWIELRNMTDTDLDLSECQLTKLSGSSETLMLIIPDENLINANEFYLISDRDKDNSNINIDSNLVDSDVSLVNSKLQIKLYCRGETWNDDNSILIDTADDGSGTPLKGSNKTPKKSMSRKLIPGDGTSGDNWYTASTSVNWDAGVNEKGTPGTENSPCSN